MRNGPRWLPVALWLAAAAAGVSQAMAAFDRPAPQRLGDLFVYRGAVEVLLHGGSLYDFVAHDGAPFTYPPFAGLVFTPLALIPAAPLRLLWTVGTLAVVLGLAVLARRDGGRPLAGRPLAGRPLTGRPLTGRAGDDPSARRDGDGPFAGHLPRPLAMPALAVVLFMSAPVSSNIRFGQISLVLVVLVLVDCLGVVPARWRGVATGVAAAIKLTPLIFVPYWWLAGQRRTVVTATATFLGATALAWAVLPGDSYRFWLTELWNVERVGDLAAGRNQSLTGALLRWGVPEPAHPPLLLVLGLAIVALALLRAVRAHQAGRPLTAAVIVGAAGLVLSPVSWTHHHVWLVLAGACVIAGRRWYTWLWAAAVVAIMLLPVTSVGARLPGGEVIGNLRVLLAVAIAALIPFAALHRPVDDPAPAGEPAPRPVAP